MHPMLPLLCGGEVKPFLHISVPTGFPCAQITFYLSSNSHTSLIVALATLPKGMEGSVLYFVHKSG